MLTKFDPFRDLDQLWEQMTTRQTQPYRGMPVDIARGKDGYTVLADLPGVDPSSIDVSVEGNVLSIRAERRGVGLDDMKILAAERPVGTYVRQLTIGEGFDLDRIGADYDAGVLTVTLPVSEQAKPRRISIRQRPASHILDTEPKENVST